MTTRPLYRWKSFWLGIFIVGFLGWAWVQSVGHDEGVRILGPDTDRASVWVSGGVFGITQWEGEMDYPSIETSWYSEEFARDDMTERRRWALLSKDAESSSFWWIAFPMWLPVVGFMALWAAWLAWHGRRKKKLAESIP
jgi:hypothetical protein